jgi:RsiW-degrading membrane proteinase PrsW (M82 family)
MNLLNILYEPYVIIIFLSVLITLITYFIIRNDKSNEKDNTQNISKTLLYTFIISFIILMLLKICIQYMNAHNFFQKGAGVETSERLTIIGDDIDCDILDN